MQKMLTVMFKDVDSVGDISLKSVPDNKENLVITVEGTTICVKVSELEQAITEIKEFNSEEQVQTG